jgi:hypothetical protein
MQIKTLAAGSAIVAALFGAASGTATAFNPQPDPPGFGIVSINPDQTIRLNVVCWGHPVDGVPPGPCHGDLMFHDLNGNVLVMQTVKLGPGQSAFLEFSPPRSAVASVLVSIDPCWIPDPTSGRALPSAEVYDTQSGRVMLHVNPMTPRISIIDNGGRGKL